MTVIFELSGSRMIHCFSLLISDLVSDRVEDKKKKSSPPNSQLIPPLGRMFLSGGHHESPLLVWLPW